jgi:hypothetical protein
LDLARKKRNNRDHTRYALRKFLEIHDGCFTRAPLTWGLPSSTPLPFLPEWQRRNGSFATSTPLFYRAYDQVIHDVALQNLPVIFAWIEQDSWRRRTTHHGVFDLAYLRCIPI